MRYHSKAGTVFMVQVDHLAGEQLGFAIQQFYDAGASNVQVVSSITKKNRPSYIFFIDCREEYRTAVEEAIPKELGAGGWHVIKTVHHYQFSDSVKRRVCVHPEGQDALYVTVVGKKFENGNLRPEHESVLEFQEAIYEKYGRHVQYQVLYHAIMEALLSVDAEPIDLTAQLR